MIRRPSRTALHSALSALAGGFRGAAVQRQQKEQRDQLALENERSALNTALRLSESGAEVMPPRAPDAPPDMPGMPAPPTVSFGGQTYRVPSASERERMRAKAAAEVAETEREATNRRAFGAFGVVQPENPRAREYDPTVEYTEVLRRLEKEQEAASTELTAPAQRELEAGRELARSRAAARAWFNSTYGGLNAQDPTISVEERQRRLAESNRLGQLYSEVASRGITDGDDVLVAMMESERARQAIAGQAALELQREATAGKILSETGGGGGGGGTGGGGGAGDITRPPPSMGMPAPVTPAPAIPAPVAPPARPAAAAPAPVAPVIPPKPSWFNDADVGMTWPEFYRANMSGATP